MYLFTEQTDEVYLISQDRAELEEIALSYYEEYLLNWYNLFSHNFNYDHYYKKVDPNYIWHKAKNYSNHEYDDNIKIVKVSAFKKGNKIS